VTPARAEVTWLGHATVLLDVAGARVLTDPVLRPRVGHLVRHAPPAALPGDLDAVLVSHLHRDHLDLPTLRGLPAGTRVIGPHGTAAALRRRSPALNVTEVGWGDERELAAGVTVRATPARHDSRRSPLSRERGEALGFVVAGAAVRIYFAGDTDLFAGMARIGDPPGLDVALLPVWGWGGRLGPGHMNPDEAAQAAAMLRPAIAVPIHWGTFLPYGAAKSHAHLLRAPGDVFVERMAHWAPEVRVVVLAPGESLEL
jgi:L-ascorbate metabolism protein UlaG (beta-lactamase superfamily)